MKKVAQFPDASNPPAKAFASPPRDPYLTDLESEILATHKSISRADEYAGKAILGFIIAGLRLNRLKDLVPYAQFGAFRAEKFPLKSDRTLSEYQRIADWVIRHFKCPYPLPPSMTAADVLETLDEMLLPAAVKYKREFQLFVAGETLKSFRERLLCDDEATGAVRSTNGKVHGGTNQNDNRFDYPLHGARKLRELAEHFSHSEIFSPEQRNEMGKVIEGAILGIDVTLPRESGGKIYRYVIDFAGKKRRRSSWPRWYCELAYAALKKRLRENEE